MIKEELPELEVEETTNLPEVDITEQKEEPTKKKMTKLELLKKRRGQ